MASPSTAKRRRLNHASSTLSKPFVSPLKTADVTRTPPRDRRSALTETRNPPYVPSTLAHTVKPTLSTVARSNAPSRPSSAITPSRPNPVRRQAYITPRRSDPAEQAAQKAITSLELQIKSVRNDIDTLNQASKYADSDADSELEALALKWRLACQGAAEELFGSVKERVNRMGGVEAWRESEKQKYERANGIGEFAEPEVEDDADCEFDSQGEELPEEEQEYRKKEKRRIKQEAMDAADVDEPVGEEPAGSKQVWQQIGSDDDSFTMDMMLRSLNIDLDVVGYDREGQRWIT
ncbi:hypothetical protein WHR41_01702 [Cladosporium halotolerans]|uniref:Uncharacterized protein n=1 Tax=Cladosporium halotolerans TaxID=1052096 RepID=A0AB34L0P5_9PEZI